MKIEITDEDHKKAETLFRGVRLNMINSNNNDSKLFGIVSTNLKIKIADDLLTLATDGENFFINPLFLLGADEEQIKHMTGETAVSDKSKIFYAKKSMKFLEFCCQHEISHCLHDHFERVGTRDRALYNQAADYRINADLAIKLWGSIQKAKQQEPIFEQLCLDEKYKDKKWTSELIYDDLLKNGSPNKKIQKVLDDHIYESADGSIDTKINNSRLKKAFIETAKSIGNGIGGELLDKIQTHKPKISWKKLLRKNLSGLVKSEVDPKRIHRRIHGLTNFLHSQGQLDPNLGMVRAGKKPEPVVNVYCLFDTSGSISNKERSLMLSETLGITKQYRDYKISVVCWGTSLLEESLKVYDKKNSKEISDYNFLNGGGTDINCISKFLSEQKLKKSDKVLVFTDMYFGDPSLTLKPYSDNIIFISTTKNMEYATRGIGTYIEFCKYQ